MLYWCDTLGMSKESLGSLVRRLRLREGMSHAVLAELVGIGKETIANLESGRTKTLKSANMRRLGEVLGEPIWEWIRAQAEPDDAGGIVFTIVDPVPSDPDHLVKISLSSLLSMLGTFDVKTLEVVSARCRELLGRPRPDGIEPTGLPSIVKNIGSTERPAKSKGKRNAG